MFNWSKKLNTEVTLRKSKEQAEQKCLKSVFSNPGCTELPPSQEASTQEHGEAALLPSQAASTEQFRRC